MVFLKQYSSILNPSKQHKSHAQLLKNFIQNIILFIFFIFISLYFYLSILKISYLKNYFIKLLIYHKEGFYVDLQNNYILRYKNVRLQIFYNITLYHSLLQIIHQTDQLHTYFTNQNYTLHNQNHNNLKILIS